MTKDKTMSQYRELALQNHPGATLERGGYKSREYYVRDTDGTILGMGASLKTAWKRASKP